MKSSVTDDQVRIIILEHQPAGCLCHICLAVAPLSGKIAVDLQSKIDILGSHGTFYVVTLRKCPGKYGIVIGAAHIYVDHL